MKANPTNNQNTLENHYLALEQLGASNGKQAYQTLLKLEEEAHELNWMLELCEGNYDKNKTRIKEILSEAQALLGGCTAIYINGNPRNQTLLLNSCQLDHKYQTCKITRDHNGNGILTPQF